MNDERNEQELWWPEIFYPEGGDQAMGDCSHPSTTEHRNGNHVIDVCDSCGEWVSSRHE